MSSNAKAEKAKSGNAKVKGSSNAGANAGASGNANGNTNGNTNAGASGAGSNAGAGAGAGGAGKPSGQFSASDLNRIVLEYLNKKGYHRTEAMLRAESSRTATPANPESPATTKNGTLPEPSQEPPAQEKNAKPVSNVPSAAGNKRDSEGELVSKQKLEELMSPESYIRAFSMLKSWADSSLEIYRTELSYFMYPIFIYLFLDLVAKNPVYARRFFDKFSGDFKIRHGSEINRLFSVNSVDHIKENEVAQAFSRNKYRISISSTALDLVLYFLNENESVGGSLIIAVINKHIQPNIVDTISSKDRLSDGVEITSDTNSGEAIEEANNVPVTLGPFPKDEDFVTEIETELKIKDEQEKKQAEAEKKKTTDSESKDNDQESTAEPAVDEERPTLLQEFRNMNSENVGATIRTDDVNDKASGDAAKVKTEDKKTDLKKEEDNIVMESPSKDLLPLPPKTALDIKIEIQKVKESRDALKLDDLEVALPSVCMYTFHNTNRDMTCLEFSDDCRLAAAGFQDSYIKVWSLDGNPLIDPKYNSASNSRISQDLTSSTLVGHSGAVYSTSFSPDNRYLLSGSEDKTVKLWSMDTQTALVNYKGHNHPVWDVKFSPLGHYFATASHDQTARLWSCDHIYPLRIFAGHTNDVDTVSFHPNGCYVFTGSNDKTCRMWDISTGDSVRLFLGHTAPILSTQASPDGRWLATGSEDGVICLWDIGTGKRIKQMRGHGKNAINSLAFSKEGNVLISGGADHSVRVWDVKHGTAEQGPEPEQTFTGRLNDITSSVNQDIKDYGRRRTIIPTNDLVASFYTKKSPIFKVQFTRSNLALAGGAFRDW
ncbi:Transcription initiation factor TFIID subunit 5 [Nakaseomyces bracarensis]|uniref:Transcription initiation factor TFIID subunit 5 n=1 Tax=Nakaseomyces bracarensis TaxID=273131 RepID=A0ABR4P138_9SACH